MELVVNLMGGTVVEWLMFPHHCFLAGDVDVDAGMILEAFRDSVSVLVSRAFAG